MTLGTWIFLSVVLVLVVLNKPFRKFFYWVAAVSAVCFGLFMAYVSLRDWQDRRERAREAAIQQRKQDDCNARLNAAGSPDAFQKLANNDLCRANPDITSEEAGLLKPGETLGRARPSTEAPVTLDFSRAQPLAPGTSTHLPPGYTLEHSQSGTSAAPNTLPADFFGKQNTSRAKTLEGTITKNAVIYGESLPSGPGGRVLGRVESGTHVRVIRLDSIFGNVQVRTQNGITGWISTNEVNY
jgi:hypothetical protein